MGMPWAWAALVVAVGGALGAVGRHVLSMPPVGPFRGVLVANVVGAGALGALSASVDALPPALFLLLGTGLCGALTTWSTLAVQTWEVGRRDVARAAAYLALTLALGLATAATTYAVLAP